MNTPQTRFITLSAMKATNTEHTAINGNQSKCRMTQFNLGGALTKSGKRQRVGKKSVPTLCFHFIIILTEPYFIRTLRLSPSSVRMMFTPL